MLEQDTKKGLELMEKVLASQGRALSYSLTWLKEFYSILSEGGLMVETPNTLLLIALLCLSLG